jgi:hypothetical protein
MKKAAKTGTYTHPFRIPQPRPQSQPQPHRKKTQFTIIDEDELRETRQAVIKLQQRVRELEKEKLQQRISPTQKRISPTQQHNSPPQKRQSPSSLPTQLQRVREKNKQDMADLGKFYDKLFARVEEFGIKKKSS